jgi:uncharacterized protein (DUF433 family)
MGRECGRLSEPVNILSGEVSPAASKFAGEMVSSIVLGIRQEKQMAQLDRITQDPEVMGGRPCVRGMRVTVGMIVGQIGAGHSIEEVLAEYPYLEREDVLQALRYLA